MVLWLQTTHWHPPLVGLISGHQEIVDLFIVHFKVAHLHMAINLKNNHQFDELCSKSKKIFCVQREKRCNL